MKILRRRRTERYLSTIFTTIVYREPFFRADTEMFSLYAEADNIPEAQLNPRIPPHSSPLGAISSRPVNWCVLDLNLVVDSPILAFPPLTRLLDLHLFCLHTFSFLALRHHIYRSACEHLLFDLSKAY